MTRRFRKNKVSESIILPVSATDQKTEYYAYISKFHYFSAPRWINFQNLIHFSHLRTFPTVSQFIFNQNPMWTLESHLNVINSYLLLSKSKWNTFLFILFFAEYHKSIFKNGYNYDALWLPSMKSERDCVSLLLVGVFIFGQSF